MDINSEITVTLTYREVIDIATAMAEYHRRYAHLMETEQEQCMRHLPDKLMREVYNVPLSDKEDGS